MRHLKNIQRGFIIIGFILLFAALTFGTLSVFIISTKIFGAIVPSIIAIIFCAWSFGVLSES